MWSCWNYPIFGIDGGDFLAMESIGKRKHVVSPVLGPPDNFSTLPFQLAVCHERLQQTTLRRRNHWLFPPVDGGSGSGGGGSGGGGRGKTSKIEKFGM